MTWRRTLIRLYWLLACQLGCDFRRPWSFLRGFPRYICDWWKFRKGYSGPMELMPCLHDRDEEGGAIRNEYFWQDLLVARRIFDERPKRHVDVGSRIDGFVAHVAVFREIEVFDVRRVGVLLPNVIFRQVDVMQDHVLASLGKEYCDSLSCLHALEHFGLGRYGDPIDPKGYEKGLSVMAALLQPGGVLYLSTPIGRERVQYNANRIFNPAHLVDLARQKNLKLLRLTVIDGGASVIELDIENQRAIEELAHKDYNLGMFTFRKNSSATPS